MKKIKPQSIIYCILLLVIAIVICSAQHHHRRQEKHLFIDEVDRISSAKPHREKATSHNKQSILNRKLQTPTTMSPSGKPSISPLPTTTVPSFLPSTSILPSFVPTQSKAPSESPSMTPSQSPSQSPSTEPTQQPSSSAQPSEMPSSHPSTSTQPSSEPSTSSQPTSEPSMSSQPSDMPSYQPSISVEPSISVNPTSSPTDLPSTSSNPSLSPSGLPSSSSMPSSSPSVSVEPSFSPTEILSSSPSISAAPSLTSYPSTSVPSISSRPSMSNKPTDESSATPSNHPSLTPSISERPSTFYPPSEAPSLSSNPSLSPSNSPTRSSSPTRSGLDLFYWGDPKSFGRTEIDRVTPLRVRGNVAGASTGSEYTIYIQPDGRAFSMGNIPSKTTNQQTTRYQGHLGLPFVQVRQGVNSIKPISVVTAADGTTILAPAFDKVFAGVENAANSGIIHSILIDNRGKVYATGSNTRGQLCIGSNTGNDNRRYIPQEIIIPSGRRIVDVAIGGEHTLLLDDANNVYGCGSNLNGQLGLGSTTQVKSPTKINISSVTSISAGIRHSIFLANNGLYVTGSNQFGQLCRTGSNIRTPFRLGTVSRGNIRQIETIKDSTYILFNDRSVGSCGKNNVGQLGDGTNTNKASSVVELDNVVSLVGGGPSSESVFFYTTDELVYATGLNSAGNLGTGNKVNVNIPQGVKFQQYMIIGILSASTDLTIALGFQAGAFPTPELPSAMPSASPTGDPTEGPTLSPTVSPTLEPTLEPTQSPTLYPTLDPTLEPTLSPTNLDPTLFPTKDPTLLPTAQPTIETDTPTLDPTSSPSLMPVKDTLSPTLLPTLSPSKSPIIDTDTGPSSPSVPDQEPPSTSPNKQPVSEPPTFYEPTKAPIIPGSPDQPTGTISDPPTSIPGSPVTRSPAPSAEQDKVNPNLLTDSPTWIIIGTGEMPTPPKIQPPTPKPVYVVYVPIFGGSKSSKYAKATYLPKTYKPEYKPPTPKSKSSKSAKAYSKAVGYNDYWFFTKSSKSTKAGKGSKAYYYQQVQEQRGIEISNVGVARYSSLFGFSIMTCLSLFWFIR